MTLGHRRLVVDDVIVRVAVADLAGDFDPERWHGGYPNPAFGRMTEADGAWMARIIARFDDRAVAAAVATGKYDAESSAYLTRTLIARRDLVLRRYLTRLSPLTDPHVDGDRLCAIDLARRTRVVPDDGSGDEVCVTLPEPAAKPYVVVDMRTTSAPQPLHVHLRADVRSGFRVVGIER